ncbi:hypothetical protein COBT_003402 [Conglomerata obtusa]
MTFLRRKLPQTLQTTTEQHHYLNKNEDKIKKQNDDDYAHKNKNCDLNLQKNESKTIKEKIFMENFENFNDNKNKKDEIFKLNKRNITNESMKLIKGEIKEKPRDKVSFSGGENDEDLRVKRRKCLYCGFKTK